MTPEAPALLLKRVHDCLVRLLPDQTDNIKYKEEYALITDLTFAIENCRRVPTTDEIIIWFNAWLKDPISERERTIIQEMEHVRRFPADIFQAIEDHNKKKART